MHHPTTDTSDMPSSGSTAGVLGLEPNAKLEPVGTVEPKKLVLLLEDDPVQLRMLALHVEAIGLRAVKTSTIAEANQQLSEQPIDLAVLDVHLPDGNGLDFASKIDEDPQRAGMPIVILSSSPPEDIVRKTRACGGLYFIGKPYDPNVLMTIVEKAMSDLL